MPATRLWQSRLALGVAGWLALAARAQTAYFVDGYHGGVYGHYPTNFTEFIVNSLRANPDWKINLEIEPETWDSVSTNSPEAYRALQEFARDQTASGRVEFINPAYAQSYLWNISGESVIQQLARGMARIRKHFPNAAFSSYSSEEPCFTSALPGILTSFGFSNAVLKNPNTCWGGYSRAWGGELVNWIGPDGARIRTVPRYGIESLRPGSTWETIANANSPEFIRAATAAQIPHPVGMCLQDAGWRFGPWLEHVGGYYRPTESTLWRNYFEHVADARGAPDWRLSQEDIQVSLVWGAQVLQRIAQQVRRAENQVVRAEKMATLAGVCQNEPWPGATLDEGWRTLMLSQHHDCWIVPYNGRRNQTWADKVARWTGDTCRRSEDVIDGSVAALMGKETDGGAYFARVFNTVGQARHGLAEVALPPGWRSDAVTIIAPDGSPTPLQSAIESDGSQHVLYRATCPSLGFSTYRLEPSPSRTRPAAISSGETNDLLTIETDLYKLTIDCRRGGTIQSLVAKRLGARELVEGGNARRFNEIRGYFYGQHRFFSTADQPAEVELLEDGPLRFRVRIRGQIESNLVTQVVTLVQGEPLIDFSVRIDWSGRPGIGADYAQSAGFRPEDDHKAFYDDRYKLLALFPLDLPGQKIFKDAPFDVTASRLADTFFQNWSEIKNNIILHWVDAYDPERQAGVALLTDHTTSYAHSADHLLGLTLQYSGIGLWGRNYGVQGPSEIHYALLPHAGDWERADVWNAAAAWNEPFIVRIFQSAGKTAGASRSLVGFERDGWEVPTARLSEGKVLVRLFNPSARESTNDLHYGGPASKVELVQLDGRVLREVSCKQRDGEVVCRVALPPFGLGTLRITP